MITLKQVEIPLENTSTSERTDARFTGVTYFTYITSISKGDWSFAEEL